MEDEIERMRTAILGYILTTSWEKQDECSRIDDFWYELRDGCNIFRKSTLRNTAWKRLLPIQREVTKSI